MDTLAPALRPELLRGLLTQLPLAGGVSGAAVAHVCGALQAHLLLTEAAPASAEAVDAFVERVVALSSAQQEESRAAAAVLLAAILRGCTLRRFAAQVAPLGAQALALLRPSEPQRVRVAACGAVCAAVARATAVADAAPSVRRDVAALLSKAFTLLLPEISARESAGSALAEAGLQLVYTVAAGGCASVLRAHADAAEAAGAAALVAPGGSGWAGRALAVLPRVSGEASVWSMFARRVLLAVHASLDVALRGAEPPGAGAAARGSLEAPGEPPPRALDLGSGDASASGGAQRASLWLGVAAALLEAPFLAAVPFPTVPLFALVARVLAADGRPVPLQPGAAPLPVSPALLLALPALHASALALLSAALRSGRRAAMLQVAGPTGELLCAALRSGAATAVEAHAAGNAAAPPPPAVPTCPALRTALYSATACYLHTMGGSFAAGLGPELVAAAVRDLAVPRHAAHAAQSELGAPRAGGKKRKHDAASLEEAGAAAARPAACATGLAADGDAGAAGATVRTAALRALEALCTVAGGVLAERARADLDAAAAAAAAAAAGADAIDTRCATSSTERVAAYACLLASVLAPRPRRAPHLPLALALFRRGADEPGTAELCSRALLALEAVIHPVAPPRAQPRDMADPTPHGRDDVGLGAQRFGVPAGVPPPLSRFSAPMPAAAPVRSTFGVAQLPAPAVEAAAPVAPASVIKPFAASSAAAAAVSTDAVPALPAARAAAAPPAAGPTRPPQLFAAQLTPGAAGVAAGAALGAREARPTAAPAAVARHAAAAAAASSDSEGSLPDIVLGDSEASSSGEEQ